MDQSGNVISQREGMAKSVHHGDKSATAGYAWAARRDYLDEIGGLPPFNIVGGADTLMARAWLGQSTRADLRDDGAPALNDWNTAWMANARTAMRRQRRTCGFIEGRITHLFHGSKSNRQFATRQAILRDAGFDPSRHARLNNDGIVELNVDDDTTKRIRQFFLDREEDQ